MYNTQAFQSQGLPKPCGSSRANNLFYFAILIFTLCFFPSNAEAGEVTLAWDPPSAEYGGFILSYGISSSSYSDHQDVGINTTHTVDNLDAGQTYFFAVKTYNTNHDVESSYSNQVNATVSVPDTVAPASPKNVQIFSGE